MGATRVEFIVGGPIFPGRYQFCKIPMLNSHLDLYKDQLLIIWCLPRKKHIRKRLCKKKFHGSYYSNNFSIQEPSNCCQQQYPCCMQTSNSTLQRIQNKGKLLQAPVLLPMQTQQLLLATNLLLDLNQQHFCCQFGNLFNCSSAKSCQSGTRWSLSQNYLPMF